MSNTAIPARFKPLASVVLIIVFGVGFCTETARAESWTDLRGTRTIEARMVGLWGDSVILEMLNGKRISVKLDALRSESRIQAQDLARQWQKTRGTRIGELQGRATEAAAPAPNPLPMPPAAPPYAAPKTDLAIGAFLDQIETLVRDGHVRAIYDSLPLTYRNDINDIVKLAAEKSDQATWNASIGKLQQFGEAVVTKQRWFLSSPRVKQLPPDTFNTMAEEVLTTAGGLRVGLSPDVISLEKLRTTPIDKCVADLDAAIAPFVAQLFSYGGRSGRTVTVDSEKEDTAVVSIEQEGKKSRVTFTKVDGFWVPKSMADSWTESVESAKATISESTGGDLFPAVTGFATMVGSFSEPMLASTTADQYHGAMESIFSGAALMETALAGFGDMIGKRFSLTGKSPNGGYGYDDYSGMDDYDDYSGMDESSNYEEEMRRQEEQMNSGF
ncbi:MAG: hypothetical protein WBD31_02855 [Rubripirellula sp.]